jgi:hypothetical protein
LRLIVFLGLVIVAAAEISVAADSLETTFSPDKGGSGWHPQQP